MPKKVILIAPLVAFLLVLGSEGQAFAQEEPIDPPTSQDCGRGLKVSGIVLTSLGITFSVGSLFGLIEMGEIGFPVSMALSSLGVILAAIGGPLWSVGLRRERLCQTNISWFPANEYPRFTVSLLSSDRF